MSGSPVGLPLDSPARQRLAEDLLGWGQARPTIDPDVVVGLRAQLEEGLAGLGKDLSRAASLQRRGHLLITKTKLDRLVCDGLQLDAVPFEHTRASVRGILTHAVVERDWDQQRRSDAEAVVADVWYDEACRRPGDPNSLSAWMNASSDQDAASLREELVELLESFREVWPPLPPGQVRRSAEQAIEVSLAGGQVRLFGRPDLVLDSPRRDDRARALVVDLKTGRPRSEHDRHELRFYALLVALGYERPPFRWATYYVTEGRHEAEDLRADTLIATARRVIDTVRQLVRLELKPEELRIRGGGWCFMCKREQTCEQAAQARADRVLSHPDAII